MRLPEVKLEPFAMSLLRSRVHCSKWHTSGAVYVGQWVHGQREGAGKYSWHPMSPSQTTPASFEYEGEFRANLRSGVGM